MNSSAALPPPISGVATFEKGADGLTRLRIKTAAAEAELTLEGAHVTHFQPAHSAPVLFLSGSSDFAPGKPIRGGVPVCFPWFSARAGRPELPAHGFARIVRWDLESLAGSEERGVAAVLRLASNEQTRAQWPHDFIARLCVKVTSQLSLTLEIENSDSAPFKFEEALHTYFVVSDVRTASVTGLENAFYLDKMDGSRRKQLGSEPLRFTGETDRVFTGTSSTCVIDDPGMRRRIIIEKSGSQSTVVWNPWIAKAAAMPDFGDHEWPGMLCIETANVGDHAIALAPGAKHAMSATIRLA